MRIALLLLLPLLSSCLVVSVASTAVSVGASAVGVAADVAVGTAKVAGKAVGAAVDAASGDSDPDKPGVSEEKPKPGPLGPRK